MECSERPVAEETTGAAGDASSERDGNSTQAASSEGPAPAPTETATAAVLSQTTIGSQQRPPEVRIDVGRPPSLVVNVNVGQTPLVRAMARGLAENEATRKRSHASSDSASPRFDGQPRGDAGSVADAGIWAGTPTSGGDANSPLPPPLEQPMSPSSEQQAMDDLRCAWPRAASIIRAVYGMLVARLRVSLRLERRLRLANQIIPIM